MHKYTAILGCLGFLLPFASLAAPAYITTFDRAGRLAWSGVSTAGVCTVEIAPSLGTNWFPLKTVFTTNATGRTQIEVPGAYSFYRLNLVTVPPTRAGFTNLAQSYSLLTTLAGSGGGRTDGVNYWQPGFEGGPAASANLSRPHFAMADDAGNIYIVDKNAHAVRKVTPDGTIHTVAGNNTPGNDGDTPGPATQRRLRDPNGLWVRRDGTFYILDKLNFKIRRVGTNGMMTTLFTVSTNISLERGLWVSNDESLAYGAAFTNVIKWTPANGVSVFARGFNELGNIVVDPGGKLVVTDRGAHRVYRLSNTGVKTAIAGNGNKTGGGDGQLALSTGLTEVRGVWFLPTGGYFLATHLGSQIWYVDTAGYIHRFVDGKPGAHAGDGGNYNTPGNKISELRSVTLDRDGNMLITENDYGFVRKIRLLRQLP